MLVIRDEQIQQLIAADDSELINVVAAAVRAANETRVGGYDDTKLKSMAAAGVEAARAKGADRADDLAAFVALMFEISPRFYDQPLIATVLADENYAVSERIQQLPDRVPDEAWAEAEKMYVPDFWFGGTAETQADATAAVDYADLAARQFEKVEKLKKSAAPPASDTQYTELDVETERLRHYQNAAKGSPRERAARALAAAKKSALNKAIVQPL